MVFEDLWNSMTHFHQACSDRSWAIWTALKWKMEGRKQEAHGASRSRRSESSAVASYVRRRTFADQEGEDWIMTKDG